MCNICGSTGNYQIPMVSFLAIGGAQPQTGHDSPINQSFIAHFKLSQHYSWNNTLAIRSNTDTAYVDEVFQ
jgi:hypothetical protein